jgi:hypothetical protein
MFLVVPFHFNVDLHLLLPERYRYPTIILVFKLYGVMRSEP